MNDPRAELELANQRFAEALPSWAKDGSAERPAGPPQLPLPLQRPARLAINTPAEISGGGTGGSEDLPLVESIVLVDGILKFSNVAQIVGADVT